MNTLILCQKYLKEHQNLRDYCSESFLERNPLSSWVELWQKEEFDQLSIEIDRRLEEISESQTNFSESQASKTEQSGDGPLVRLWWVAFNSLQAGLPLLALNSPLDELYEHYLEKNEGDLGSGVCHLVFLLAGSLYNRNGQSKLALLNLTRAEELAVKLGNSDKDRLVCLKALEEMLVKEKSEAKTRREPIKYRDELDKQEASVLESLKELEKAVSGEKEASAQTLSAVLSETLEESPASEKTETPEPDYVVPDSVIDSSGESLDIDSEKQFDIKDRAKAPQQVGEAGEDKHSSFLPVLFVGLGIVLFYERDTLSDIFLDGKGEEIFENVSSSGVDSKKHVKRVVKKTDLERKVLVNNVDALQSELDERSESGLVNIDKRLTELEERRESRFDEDAPEPRAQEGEEGVQQEGKFYDPSTIKKVESLPALASDSISSKPPRAEPDSNISLSAAEKRRPGFASSPVLPVDEKKYSGIRPTKLEARLPSARQGSDGRVYGPGPTPGSKDLRGRQVRSYPVDQFNPPKEYRTLAGTDVFTGPSLLSGSNIRLDKGVLVKVVAQVGYWLEIESVNGRARGYIYSQDAVLVK